MRLTDQVWLVTGGAGYIGAHVVRSLQAAGATVVVVDDLSRGDPARVDCPLIEIDVSDTDRLTDALADFEVSGVMHLAADKDVEESTRLPVRYYQRNVQTVMSLLSAMEASGVERLVFSSSAAVYGMTADGLVSEDAATVPINPYGETKLIGEWLIKAQAQACGLRYAALRYFNVAGAGSPELGDHGETNLIPLVFRAVDAGLPPLIFGDDYPTPDGTCVRDFIHVADLADAHVATIALLDEPGANQVLNVGCGKGFSVREVIDVVGDVVGQRLAPVVKERRAGDPASVVASAARIREQTGWRNRFELEDMVRSAWEARRKLS